MTSHLSQELIPEMIFFVILEGCLDCFKYDDEYTQLYKRKKVLRKIPISNTVKTMMLENYSFENVSIVASDVPELFFSVHVIWRLQAQL